MLRNINSRLVLVIAVLLLGLIYRLVVTSGGNYIFHMDTARDMVDVREMVVLQKFRLIGPTSGIEGLYTGPGWYYLLAIPFIISGGDPYASIIMEAVLWFVGGVYLYKITSKWGIAALIVAEGLWVSSNYIMLAGIYAFNPNPIIFLTPVFVYYFGKYLEKHSYKNSILTFSLAGSFFHFEMAFGIFMLPIIFLVMLLTKKKDYFISKYFVIGIMVYLLFFLPQGLFEIRHNFLSLNAIINHLSMSSELNQSYDFFNRLARIYLLFWDVFLVTFMNFKVLVYFFIFGLLFSIGYFRKKLLDNQSVLIALMMIIVPFIGYILVPINVYSWHIGGSMVAGIIILGFFVKFLSRLNMSLGLLSGFIILSLSIYNIYIGNLTKNNNHSDDPSFFINEEAAIKYIYENAHGKDFKVYSYLPSVIDFPYQYLIWWIGLKEYGYIPSDYAYLPDKPQYIKNKDKFSIPNKEDKSGLIFLIKEPDRIRQRHLWENNFKQYSLIKTKEIGPLQVEIRQETSNEGN